MNTLLLLFCLLLHLGSVRESTSLDYLQLVNNSLFGSIRHLISCKSFEVVCSYTGHLWLPEQLPGESGSKREV